MFFSAHRGLLTRSGLSTTFLLTCTSRLGFAALPLCLLFTVRQATGSFLSGALALGVLALCSLSMPLKSRLVDRWSQRMVLPALGLVVGTSLAAAALMGSFGAESVSAWVAVAAAVGLSAPPLGPCMRAQWRQGAPDDVRLAYGLDSAAEEAVWMAGPALAGLALSTVPAWLALSSLPWLLIVGCLGLGLSRFGTERVRAPVGRATGRGIIVLRGVSSIVLVMATFGVLTSLVITGVAARADVVGRLDLAGFTEASIGLGAVVGGLCVGLLPAVRSWSQAIGAVLLAWGCAMTGGAIIPLGIGSLIPFFLVGLCSAPIWVICYEAADRSVHENQRTEASTWVSTAANVGGSIGTAMAGLLVAAWGAGAVHWLAAALAVVAAGACFALPSRRFRA